MSTANGLWRERGGAGERLLVLLHGMGANGTVWDGVRAQLARLWPGRWLIPDLRGHGRSFHRAPYGMGIHAADVAALMAQDEAVTVLGHSMGGVVGFALASGLFGVRVERVVAFGVKVDWSTEEIERVKNLARTPPKLFATRAEAIDRYLRVSGLHGLVAAEAEAAGVGVREVDGGFRLAADPGTNAIGNGDFVGLAHATDVPRALLCGELDNVARPDSMARLGAAVTVLPGLGHNAHVQAPEAFCEAISGVLGA